NNNVDKLINDKKIILANSEEEINKNVSNIMHTKGFNRLLRMYDRDQLIEMAKKTNEANIQNGNKLLKSYASMSADPVKENRLTKRGKQHELFSTLLKGYFNTQDGNIKAAFESYDAVGALLQTYADRQKREISRNQVESILKVLVKASNTFDKCDVNNMNEVEHETFKKMRKLISKDIKVIYDALNSNKDKENFNLNEVFEQSRGLNVKIQNKDLEKVGNSVSNRIHIVARDFNGKSIDGYFTAHDPENSGFNAVNKFIEAQANDDVVKRDVLKFLLNKDSEYTKKFNSVTKEKLKLKKPDDVIALFKSKEELEKTFKKPLENDFKAFINKYNYKKNSTKYNKAVELFDNYKKFNKDLYTLLEGSKLLKDANNTALYNNRLKIDDNTNVDKRNSAMSMVSELLGCDKLLAKSRNMSLKIGDKNYKGTFMEKADGEDINTFTVESKMIDLNVSQVDDSPSLISDIANMQIIDYICGNVDRHTGNFLYKFETVETEQGQKTKVVGIKGIDNDFSFLSDLQKKNNNTGNLVPLENMLIIPKKTADYILQLDVNVLRGMLVGYDLTAVEVDKAVNRFNDVKNAIIDGINYYKDKDVEKIERGHLKIVDDNEMKELHLSDLTLPELQNKKSPNQFTIVFNVANEGLDDDAIKNEWQDVNKYIVESYKEEDKVHNYLKQIKTIKKKELLHENLYNDMITRCTTFSNRIKNANKAQYIKVNNEKVINKGFRDLTNESLTALAGIKTFITNTKDKPNLSQEDLKALEIAEEYKKTVEKLNSTYNKINNKILKCDNIATHKISNGAEVLMAYNAVKTAKNDRDDTINDIKPLNIETLEGRLITDEILLKKNVTRVKNKENILPPHNSKADLVINSLSLDSRRLFINLSKQAKLNNYNLNKEDGIKTIEILNANSVLRSIIESDPNNKAWEKLLGNPELLEQTRNNLITRWRTDSSEKWNALNEKIFSNLQKSMNAVNSFEPDYITDEVKNDINVFNRYSKKGTGYSDIKISKIMSLENIDEYTINQTLVSKPVENEKIKAGELSNEKRILTDTLNNKLNTNVNKVQNKGL
ncbi:MAG: hypothetical protein K6G11_10090, partial [Lachnospiraceae bacterium]|nr:hypothetical protein [Lachnospiraceae bacterium]